MPINRLINCFLVFCLLTACTRLDGNRKPEAAETLTTQLAQSLLTATPHPTLFLTSISSNNPGVLETETSVSSDASPALLAVTFVANQRYLKECEAINSSRQVSQFDYRGLLPGKSTNDDVKLLMGMPKEKSQFEKTETWKYDGFNVDVENGNISLINVYEDTQIMLPLQELIVRYGCPDLIFAFDTSIDQPSGNYDLTSFIYLTNGLEIIMSDYPVSLSDIPLSVILFSPLSLENYLKKNNYLDYGFEDGKPMTWNEAIR